jgi:formate dehydrogenase iron-sulfur subunit
MADKAILVDTSKCIACKGCQIACKQWTELAAGESEFFASTDGYENPSDLSADTYTLIKFHSSEKANGDPDWLFRKQQCFHCTDAECLNNCPTSTIKRSEDGFIFIDGEGCIGCGTCVNVCPFGIPKLSDGTKEGDGGITKSYKCWACQDRVTNGQETACVHTCAPDAQVFGDRDELLAQAKQRKTELEAKGKTVYIYGETEKGGLHYMYILLGDPQEVYGLPSSDELNSSSRRAYIRKLRDQGRRYAQRILGKAIAV